LKLKNNISDWTPEDSDEYVSLMNWRTRLFFGRKIRIRTQRTVGELQRIYRETGEQATLHNIKEIHKRVPGGNTSWLEYVVVAPNYFNAIVALVIIVVVIYATS
jgi:hypothetical protein